MKITILDGALDSSPRFWSNYMRELVGVLEENGSTVAHIPLKDRIIDHCTGCFKCWVQAPGVCIITDDSQAVNRKIINSDFVLWASPMVMGFASFMLKKTIDRMIPLVHPYLVFEGGEIHHLARYKKYPLFGLLLQPEKHDCVENIVVTQRIFARTARNIKSRLAFAFTTDAPASETAQRIINAENERFHSPPISAIKAKDHVGKLRRLTVFNGSPRGESGNTPVLLNHVMNGFTSLEGNSVRIFDLQQISKKAHFADQFKNAECVLIGFPLYTDCMPGIVKEFLEELQPLTKRKKNPPLAFLVQSGFPEGLHSRYVEGYLMAVADRLNSPYLGTLVRGGCEGVRMQPEKMNRAMFAVLNDLGRQLAEEGGFEQESIDAFNKRERTLPLTMPRMKWLENRPFAKMYWDIQLIMNKVYKKRFARPYAEPGR